VLVIRARGFPRMMKVRVMKSVGVFLIFAMTTNTPVLAYTARRSPLLFSFHSQNSVIPTNTGIQFLAIPLKTGIGCLHLSNIQSISLKIKKIKGSYDYSVIPAHAGIHSSVLIQTGIQDIIMLNSFQHLNR